MKVYMKIKKVGGNLLLAICDDDILGKTLQKGKIVLHVKKEFYGGEKVNVEEAVSMIEKSTIVNMIGNNVVQKAVEKGYVHPEAVLDVEGTLHAQIVKV